MRYKFPTSKGLWLTRQAPFKLAYMQGSERAFAHDDGHHEWPGTGAPASSHGPTQNPAVKHLLLERPLALFSDECIVRGSVSPALPDIDAVMHIAYGYGTMGWLHRVDPSAHQQLKKAQYAEKGQHKLTPTSEKLVCKLLEPVIPSHELVEMLRRTDEGRRLHQQRFLPWRKFLHVWTLTATPDVSALTQVIAYLKQRETAYAILKHHERAQRPSAERDAMVNRITTALDAWRSLSPGLGTSAFLLSEEVLHALANFDLSWDNPACKASTSRVLPMLHPRHTPMGHWLRDVAHAHGQSSLAQLHEYLLRRDVKHKGRHIGLDLLKKWSAARQLLVPTDAVESLVSQIGSREQTAGLEGRFVLARILMFVLDLVRAGTSGEEPTWSVVQQTVWNRYAMIFDECVKQRDTDRQST